MGQPKYDLRGKRIDFQEEPYTADPDEEARALEQRLQLLKRQKKALEARDRFLPFVQFTMPHPEDTNNPERSLYEDAKHHRAIARVLEEVEKGAITNLILTAPPRHGKSELSTRRFPAWYSGKHPDHSVVVASYSDVMAEDFGADVRAIFQSPSFRQVFPSHKLRKGGGAKSRIQTDKGGLLVFVGRGGALTGRGAHCFTVGTPVLTIDGDRQIQTLRPKDKVLSIENGEFVQRPVEAVSCRAGMRVFRVTTAAGRVVEATEDHPFFVGGSWIETGSLAPGDQLLCAAQRGDCPYRESDSVAKVEDTGRTADVYDLQVGGTHCFFANGILVHNCLLIDDPFKDAEEARSQAIRDQAWDWFNRVAMTRLMGKKLVVITLTRWHEDDIVGRLIDPTNPHYNAIEAQKWKIINFPAIAEDDDPLGREPGEPLWPERYDLDFLLGQQRRDPLGFASLYQQRPTVEDGILFRREHVQYYTPDQLPQDLRIYAASDHAVGTDRDKHDATVLLTVGVDPQGNIYLLDCFWERARTDKVVEAMLQMAKLRRPLVWWAERGHISKSIGPFLKKRMLETQTYFNIVEVTPAANKEQRAQSIAARMSMGMVYFPKHATWTQKAIDELLKFPNGRNDDFVDSMAYIGLGLQNIIKASPAKQPDQPPKFGTLAWVKHASKLRERQERRAYAGGW